MNIVDEMRIPSSENYSNEELKGKHVRVTSNASYRHYKKFGRITGFSKKGNYIKIYFDETRDSAMFARDSLELLN